MEEEWPADFQPRPVSGGQGAEARVWRGAGGAADFEAFVFTSWLQAALWEVVCFGQGLTGSGCQALPGGWALGRQRPRHGLLSLSKPSGGSEVFRSWGEPDSYRDPGELCRGWEWRKRCRSTLFCGLRGFKSDCRMYSGFTAPTRAKV